jgi:hypothetical protein
MRRHTMQACKFVGLMILLCAAMVSPAADLILTHIFGWTQGASEVDAQVFSTSRS